MGGELREFIDGRTLAELESEADYYGLEDLLTLIRMRKDAEVKKKKAEEKKKKKEEKVEVMRRKLRNCADELREIARMMDGSDDADEEEGREEILSLQSQILSIEEEMKIRGNILFEERKR